jgi:hypothetical protein
MRECDALEFSVGVLIICMCPDWLLKIRAKTKTKQKQKLAEL